MRRSHLVRPLLAAVASGALLWPAAAAAASSPGVSAGDTVRTTKTYIIRDPELIRSPQRVIDSLESDGSLDALGLRPVGEPGGSAAPAQTMQEEPASYVVDSGRFPKGSKPADPYQYITHAECWAHLDEAVRPQGWIKNRFSYCQTYMFVRVAAECDGWTCRPAGTFIARPMLFGHGRIGEHTPGSDDRWADFLMHLAPVAVTGAYRSATLSVGMDCQGYINNTPDDDACTTAGGRTALVPSFLTDDRVSMELISQATPPTPATAQMAAGVFQPILDIDLPGFRTGPDPDGSKGGMRFDSAWYLAPTSPAEQLGSVFDRATPGMAYDLDDDAVFDVAEHIRGARANPDATDPYSPGKELAGAGPGDQIHRLAPGAGQVQDDRYNANRNETSAFCTSQWMPDKPPQGEWQCDEYPFASTYEGSARYRAEGQQYKNWWSAAWALKSDNEEAGQRLGRWYTNDRILDHDGFFVPIT